MIVPLVRVTVHTCIVYAKQMDEQLNNGYVYLLIPIIITVCLKAEHFCLQSRTKCVETSV